MKKLVMLSQESVFAGRVKSGMAEMVDSLANALSKDYAVTVICHDANGAMALAASVIRVVDEGVRKCRFSSVDYYLVTPDKWKEKVVGLVDQLCPDILHNFAEPELLSMLQTRPAKAICTFDQALFVRRKTEYLPLYDSVTTCSENYAREILNAGGALSETLAKLDFHGVTAGVLDTIFSPAKGVMLPAKFTADDHSGKQACKQRLMQTYGISGDPYICLMMCRLVKEKGLDKVLDVLDTIHDTGGVLIVVGKGDPVYEKQLRTFAQSGRIIYVGRWASPVQAAPLTAGADFYLSPSETESCGLMPMTASLYGAVPIVTMNGGLVDNFNTDNAIIVDEDGLSNAIREAATLYSDPELLYEKRRVCMMQDFSWASRKAGYIDLYEKES